MVRRNNESVCSIFHKLVLKHPDKPCFLYNDEVWTFKEVNEYANRVAQCFLSQGLSPGDDVALYMESRPEFVAIWLGLARIRIAPALINTNLRGGSLLHCITTVDCRAVICSSSLLDSLAEVEPELKQKSITKFYCLGSDKTTTFPTELHSLDDLVKAASSEEPPEKLQPGYDDRLFYIHTSGTTGLPKAAIIRHIRFVYISGAVRFFINLLPSDVIYTVLPFYHSASGIITISQCVLHGNTVAIRPKFSASKFWDDCIKYKCTVSHYIGEMCRFLLAQPDRPTDRQHQVRMMYGNGLRPQIWTQFTNRFGIQSIAEFYGSTEGNANVVNFPGKVGACGFVPVIVPSKYPVTLIKVDPDTREPIRDKHGLCRLCKPGEVGEVVGLIKSDDPLRRFDGYVNQSATEKKVIRDIFEKGDVAFLSGDLLSMDEFGFLYFMDRTGDTFRWRGENVSTTEVEGSFSAIMGTTECVCYGVEIPGVEGRAGMLAIEDPQNTIDLNDSLAAIKRKLPSYAIPLFIRKSEVLPRTTTYKYQKMGLTKEGFDVTKLKDPIWFLHPTQGKYVPLTEEMYSQLCSGQIRL